VLSLTWIIVAAAILVVLGLWVTFTATRLDRLHARVDAAQAGLDAQLVRRAAAVQYLAESAGTELGQPTAGRLSAAARAALIANPDDRERAENLLGRASNELAALAPKLPSCLDPGLHEVAESAVRVIMARRFYNDAVRDTRTLRSGRMPRLLRLAGHRELPQFFDIDDATKWSLTQNPSGGPS
jgi:hypothetical protein